MPSEYLPFGEPPRNDVEAAALLLVRYRAAKKTGPEFGAMFSRMVADPAAVLARARELEAKK